MFSGLKTYVRDVLPKRHQVPAKYWYCWLRGALEPEMEMLGWLVRSQERVVDVGGNRGVYAYHLWRLGAVVEVFEPNPMCSDVLSAWAAGKSAVGIHSVALSSRAGSANLHIPIDGVGVEHDASASLEDTGFIHAREELVPLRTLDSFRFEHVSLIKIDVEGHESSVIFGAVATIASSKPALLVEIEQRHNERPINEVFKKILDSDYKGFFVGKRGLTPLEQFDVVSHQSMEHFGIGKGAYINNFLFLHRDRLADGEYCELFKRHSLK